MELLLHSFPISAVISFATLLLLFLARVLRKTKKKLPPGPWKLPLIGSIHHLLAAGAPLPHYALRKLSRTYGPLMHLQLGQVPTVVVSSASMAKRVMKTHDLSFANRPEILISKITLYDGHDIVFAPYGDYWRQMRKICVSELLGPRNVRSFARIREDEVSKLLESIKYSSLSMGTTLPINLTEKIYALTSVVSARATFGKICKRDQDALVRIIKRTTSLGGGFDVCDLYPSFKLLHLFSGTEGKLVNLRDEFDAIMQRIIKEHEENHSGQGNGEFDLVDVLLRHQRTHDLQCPITTHTINAVIQDIIGAGTDPSSAIIEWAMSEMMRHPKVMDKAQTEVREALKGKETIREEDTKGLKYLKSVIKETLRLRPAHPLLVPRESREDCNIDGYDIPAKTKVIVNAWAIARDPEYWDDADSFVPERFEDSSVDVMGNDFQLIPFGAGRRMCPGILFGLANVEFPLAQLLYHFNWKLPGGMKPEDLDMTEKAGLTAGRRNALCLVATPYDRFA